MYSKHLFIRYSFTWNSGLSAMRILAVFKEIVINAVKLNCGNMARVADALTDNQL